MVLFTRELASLKVVFFFNSSIFIVNKSFPKHSSAKLWEINATTSEKSKVTNFYSSKANSISFRMVSPRNLAPRGVPLCEKLIVIPLLKQKIYKKLTKADRIHQTCLLDIPDQARLQLLERALEKTNIRNPIHIESFIRGSVVRRTSFPVSKSKSVPS